MQVGTFLFEAHCFFTFWCSLHFFFSWQDLLTFFSFTFELLYFFSLLHLCFLKSMLLPCRYKPIQYLPMLLFWACCTHLLVLQRYKENKSTICCYMRMFGEVQVQSCSSIIGTSTQTTHKLHMTAKRIRMQ